MSCDILASKFLNIRVIDPQNILDKGKKEVFLLGTIDALEKFVTALQETLAVVCTVIKDLTFSLI